MVVNSNSALDAAGMYSRSQTPCLNRDLLRSPEGFATRDVLRAASAGKPAIEYLIENIDDTCHDIEGVLNAKIVYWGDKITCWLTTTRLSCRSVA